MKLFAYAGVGRRPATRLSRRQSRLEIPRWNSMCLTLSHFAAGGVILLICEGIARASPPNARAPRPNASTAILKVNAESTPRNDPYHAGKAMLCPHSRACHCTAPPIHTFFRDLARWHDVAGQRLTTLKRPPPITTGRMHSVKARARIRDQAWRIHPTEGNAVKHHSSVPPIS